MANYSNSSNNLPAPQIERGEYSLESVVTQFGEDSVNEKQLEFDNEVSIKQLSEFKYASLFGMIREYIANSMATTLEAKETIDDTYNPLIHVGYQKHISLVQIVDNGMGIPRNIIDKVCTEGGKTTQWSDPKKPGRYGIGMISAYKGVGSDGGFYMETRSRVTDEHIKAFWVGDKFIEVDNVESRLDEGQYGTFFEFPLKKRADIREYVKRASYWSPIPVQYTEYRGNDQPVFDDEFGSKEFLENADPTKVLVFENEYVKLVNAPRRSNDKYSKGYTAGIDATNPSAPETKTAIIGIPIKRNHSLNFTNLPFRDVYVHIKQEARFVIDNSPHVGKIMLSRSDYNSQLESGKNMDSFVMEDDVAENAVLLPMPAGDRDRLQKNPTFWKWAENKLKEVYKQKINFFINQYRKNNSYTDIGNETRQFFASTFTQYLKHASKKANQSDKIKRGIDRFESSNNNSFTQDEKNLLADFKQLVSVYKQTDTGTKTVQMTLLDVFENELGKDGDVFLSYIPTDKKARVVWEDNSNNVILKIANSELYNKYEERYGWTKLKDITEDTIDQYDISDTLRDKFNSDKQYSSKNTKNAGKSAENRELTVYKNYGYKKTRFASTKWRTSSYSFTAQELKQQVIDGEINNVVLFPSNSEYKISDYKKTVTSKKHLSTRCTVKTANYLTDVDGIETIESAIEPYHNIEVETSEGEMKWDKVTRSFKNVFVHIPSSEKIESMVTTPEGMKTVKSIFTSISNSSHGNITNDNTVYVPMDKHTFNKLYVGTAIVSPPCKILFMHPLNETDKNTSYYLPSNNYTHKVPFRDEMKMYVSLKLSHLEGTDVFDKIKSMNYNPTSVSIVDLISTVDEKTANKIIEKQMND